MLENEEDYLTSKGFQGRALKAMLDRAIQPKDTQTYDLSVGNINEYGIIENFIENSWIVLTNFPDYVLRAWPQCLQVSFYSAGWEIRKIRMNETIDCI